jgi:hypothetical protein
MNKKLNRVPTEFAPETRFAVTPAPAAPFRGTAETELDRLKDRLLREWLNAATDPTLYAPLRRASNEATALAWATPYPLLFLPELFREKAEAARRYTRKQATLIKRCLPGIVQAA